ncbi:ABC transporter permease [Paenibacillus roseipurpureus]|uniref:ABC transporter permease subunit n=1 Tax=Paenibacillus roseopurpureus TaxID=2918901 RepID=A0AA96RLB9_9BACL|nr:ABC transporter permease subunit [Paenibacillus sp. MBLB1832]WNR45244.1 ABC transporter permease subunit [Paenibacillus sp. MBLB1832]
MDQSPLNPELPTLGKSNIATEVPGKARKNMKNKEWKLFWKNRELSLLFLPGFIYKLVLAYLPMIGIIIAFKNYRYDLGIIGSKWIGFKNFEFFFASQDAFRVTRNTIFYNLGYMTITTIAALAFAVMLNEISQRSVKVYQTIMFLPYFLSWVIVSYITYAFLDYNSGYINHFLQSIGLAPKQWYLDYRPWPYILNAAHLWKAIGFSTLVYYAGIIGIDTDYYEAARIDGASRMQMIFKITLPMLTPLIVILLILAIGGMFRGDFGLHYFIPNNSGPTFPTTDIIDTYVYRALRALGDISMSAAVGFYQSVVGLILVVGANYVVKKMNDENSLF